MEVVIGKQQILVVDDDPNIRSIIKHILESNGYEVETAEDGDEGLKLALKGESAAAILDVMMPGKNGFEVCYQIKNHSDTADMPVLMLTATTQGSFKSDEHWEKRSKADDFITKPFQSADLVKRIDKLTEVDWRENQSGTRFKM